MEMQGTRDLPSVSFIKQTLPVCSWIYLFDDKNYISLLCFKPVFQQNRSEKENNLQSVYKSAYLKNLLKEFANL